MDPRPQGVLLYTASELGVAHRLHGAGPMETISKGASAGKNCELPGDTKISDTHIQTVPHFTALRNMASQHQACKDTTDRRRRHTNRQSVLGHEKRNNNSHKSDTQGHSFIHTVSLSYLPHNHCICLLKEQEMCTYKNKFPGGDEIFRPSRPALGPTQPSVQ